VEFTLPGRFSCEVRAQSPLDLEAEFLARQYAQPHLAEQPHEPGTDLGGSRLENAAEVRSLGLHSGSNLFRVCLTVRGECCRVAFEIGAFRLELRELPLAPVESTHSGREVDQPIFLGIEFGEPCPLAHGPFISSK
jgi:hypothetical protein